MRSKTEAKRHGMQPLSLKTNRLRKVIRGKNCWLKRFEENDKPLEDLLLHIFNEQEIDLFLNREYTVNKSRTKIRKWIKKKTDNPVEVWYKIMQGRKCTGYVCFKWRLHYDRACEISTAIGKEFRGLKLGYESSGILIEYVKSLNYFDYIVAYVHVRNNKAASNIRKLGFRKSNRLHKTITTQFYGEPSKGSGDRVYDLYSVRGIN